MCLKIIKFRRHLGPAKPTPEGERIFNIDPDMVNMYNNKDLKMARWKWATSSDGNCIFIPKDTPYQVRHYGTSSSINFKWSKFDATIKDFPVDECDNAPTSAGKR